MRLTKHHGLGNDFLVLLDRDGGHPVSGERARALCQRRTGVGADGLIRATAGGDTDLAMELYNADGGRAEMSGNGIRCLVQAAADAGMVREGEVRVATDAGLRVVDLEPEREPGLRWSSVDMGLAREGGVEGGPSATDADPWPSSRPARRRTPPIEVVKAQAVDVGNPHAVLLLADAEALAAADAEAGAVNVEYVVAGPGEDEITMRVWERGVGETLSCGTGACAAAWAAHRWGLVGTTVAVHQPGGTAVVELRPDTVVLRGPARHVATVEVPDR